MDKPPEKRPRQYAREAYDARLKYGLPAARAILASAPDHLRAQATLLANLWWDRRQI